MRAILTSVGVLRAGVALLLLAGLVGGGIVYFAGGAHHVSAAHEDHDNIDPAQVLVSVKTVRPHYDKTFSMLERRPADVVAYYRDELESRVPGVIAWIQTDKGDVVKKGDVLIKIDVPDLTARVKEEQANLHRAKAQVDQKKAALVTAQAEKKVYQSKVNALAARERSDKAYLTFRGKQKERYNELLQQRSIQAMLVEEQEDQYTAALEKLNATKEEKAAVEVQYQEEAEAKIEQARADLEEANRKVEVVQADLEHAKALLDFATIRAPFDGVIVNRDRHANVGAVVQKAETGTPKPLLTIERSDIVTVVMQVPDNFAPYVSPDTEAIFETTALPGVKFHGKVTRYPSSLDNPRHDRTMTVEVDLWKDTPQEFNKKKDDPIFRDGLKKGMPGDPRGGLPLVPDIKGQSAGRRLHLLPGMFGQMTLLLRTFENVYLLPSSSIVIQGGNSYIYVVQDGKAHLQPVKVQVDDGKLVKVELQNAQGEILGDLTGKEEVIVSNQGQLSEGQPVKPALVEDWKTVLAEKKNE